MENEKELKKQLCFDEGFINTKKDYTFEKNKVKKMYESLRCYKDRNEFIYSQLPFYDKIRYNVRTHLNLHGLAYVELFIIYMSYCGLSYYEYF
tara:strand:+ start:3313 stop:3591 length:279 start_codon:yes stop_codon:yes gene_type:complete